MVLVEHFCIHRCTPDGVIEMLWMYQSELMGNKQPILNKDEMAANNPELEALKNQIALFHGMYGFSVETKDILKEQPTDSKSTTSSAPKNSPFSLLESYDCLQVDTATVQKVLIKRPEGSRELHSCNVLMNNDEKNTLSLTPSIFLSVMKPCPKTSVLVTTVAALWEQFNIFHGSCLFDEIEKKSSFEIIDRWWTSVLSPLECGGYLLKSLSVLPVLHSLDDPLVKKMNDVIRKEDGTMGSLILFTKSGQPRLLSLQGLRLKPEFRNLLSYYCSHNYQHLIENESADINIAHRPLTTLFSDTDSNLAITNEVGEMTLRIFCLKKKSNKRLLAILWKLGQTSSEEVSNAFTNYIIGLAPLSQSVFDSQASTGFNFKIQKRVETELDMFWYIVANCTTGLAVVNTDFPLNDAHHLWNHLENLCNNQSFNSCQLQKITRGYWISLQQKEYNSRIYVDTVADQSQTYTPTRRFTEQGSQGDFDAIHSRKVPVTHTITYILLSKTNRWNSLHDTKAKIQRFIDQFDLTPTLYD